MFCELSLDIFKTQETPCNNVFDPSMPVRKMAGIVIVNKVLSRYKDL